VTNPANPINDRVSNMTSIDFVLVDDFF